MKKKPAPPTRRKPGPKPGVRMTQVMVRMPYELLDRLAKHAYRTKADRSTVIRAALDEFLPR